MAIFLLDVALPFGIIVSLLALIHCLFARKGTAWFLIIILLGPFGGLFYLAAHFRWVKFEPKFGKASSATESTATRRCPSCQQLVGVLHDVNDGRATLQLCSMCKSELEIRQSGFSLKDL